jgi:hypothetical protein
LQQIANGRAVSLRFDFGAQHGGKLAGKFHVSPNMTKAAAPTIDARFSSDAFSDAAGGCIDSGNHDPVLGPEITWRELRANRLKKRAGI